MNTKSAPDESRALHAPRSAGFGALGRRLILIGMLFLAGSGRPAAAAEAEKPYSGSAEFQRMKGLVGTWKAKTDMGEGPVEITIEYRLVSGGSVVEERIFAGTPKEMVTMYYDKNGKLALTHYCMLANRPGMVLESASGKTLRFDFDATCGVNAKVEKHMHSLSLTFDDADTITQEWKLHESGKDAQSHPFVLHRVKS